MISWDDPDKRFYHHGLDRGVLYITDPADVEQVTDIVPWNGLTSVNERGDAQQSVLYRDGRIYHTETVPGNYEATVTAFTYPDAFASTIGVPEIADGFYASNQETRRFHMSYRTLVGSGSRGDRFGHLIHIVYNAVPALGSVDQKTISNSVSPNTFAFEITATPVSIPGIRPTAHFYVDTRGLDAALVAEIEGVLYGTPETPARLIDPIELYEMLNFGDSIVFTDLGDGAWSAEGSNKNLVWLDDEHMTWAIKNVDGEDHGDGTFTMRDTE